MANSCFLWHFNPLFCGVLFGIFVAFQSTFCGISLGILAVSNYN